MKARLVSCPLESMDEGFPEDEASTDLFLGLVLGLEEPEPVHDADEWAA